MEPQDVKAQKIKSVKLVYCWENKDEGEGKGEGEGEREERNKHSNIEEISYYDTSGYITQLIEIDANFDWQTDFIYNDHHRLSEKKYSSKFHGWACGSTPPDKIKETTKYNKSGQVKLVKKVTKDYVIIFNHYIHINERMIGKKRMRIKYRYLYNSNGLAEKIVCSRGRHRSYTQFVYEYY